MIVCQYRCHSIIHVNARCFSLRQKFETVHMCAIESTLSIIPHGPSLASNVQKMWSPNIQWNTPSTGGLTSFDKLSASLDYPLYVSPQTQPYVYLYHGRKIMTNQRTGNASIIFHNHPLCLPTCFMWEVFRSMNTDLLELVISNTTDRVTSSLKN